MPEKQLTLAESLQRIEQISTSLKELGVPAHAITDVMIYVDEYVEIKSNLEKARQLQFHDDAYDALYQFNQSSRKNVEQLAIFLRRFAEHCVHFALESSEMQEQAIVDRLPTMSELEIEEEEK